MNRQAMSQERTLAAFKTVLGHRPIAYHASLARALKSVTAGILLSQLLYWMERGGSDEDGWIWKTRDELEEETALTRTEQETARKVLVKAGVMEEKLRGVPARMHFRITEVHMERLIELLTSGIPESEKREPEAAAVPPSQLAGNLPTGWRETSQPVRRKAPNLSARKRPTITETTSESTQRSPHKLPQGGSANAMIALTEKPRRTRRRDVDKVDPDKYFRGAHALCPVCGSRPCAPDCPELQHTSARTQTAQ
jgi:hypothetical protein